MSDRHPPPVQNTDSHQDQPPHSAGSGDHNHTSDTNSTQTSNGSGAQPSPQNESTANSNPQASSLASDLGLYQLMDAVFGRNNRDPPADSNQGQTTETSGPDPLLSTDPEVPGGLQHATLSNEAPDQDNSGSIVITVNYMFMEGGNQDSPGRTGSLVVTLPNNAANREPRIILQFILLATRMAYSALVTNAPKVQPGVTLDKFNSFALKAANEVRDATCAICFEQYDAPPVVTEKAETLLETVATKKRKTGLYSHTVSETSSMERVDNTNSASTNNSSEPTNDLNRPTASANDTAGHDSTTNELTTNESTTVESTTNESNASESTEANNAASATSTTDTEGDPAPRPKYLCEHDEEYAHLPLQLPCGHTFGQSCLSHWLKENTSCPLCRVSLGEPRERPQVAPISYIRFGGLNSDDRPESAGTDSTANSIIERASLVLFSPLLAGLTREAPPPPLVPNAETRDLPRPRNSLVSPVIENILSYFGRARRQRESGATEPLFASGVASRRTANGVETVTSDHMGPQEDFRNLVSLTGHHGDAGIPGTSDSNTSADGDAASVNTENATTIGNETSDDVTTARDSTHETNGTTSSHDTTENTEASRPDSS